MTTEAFLIIIGHHVDSVDRRGHGHAVARRPGFERGKDRRKDGHAVAQLTRAARQRAFARQPHGGRAAGDRRGMTDVGKAAGLAHERITSGERARIDQLEKHRRAPAFRLVDAAEAGETGSQGFDEQRERVAFVTEVRPAERKYRAGTFAEQRRRIVGRLAIRIHQPRPGQPSALREQPLRHRVGGRRHADVHQHRIAVVVTAVMPVGNPAAMGFGVMRGAVPPNGVTPVFAGSEQVRMMMRPASVTGFR